jgi:hypothetical protein
MTRSTDTIELRLYLDLVCLISKVYRNLSAYDWTMFTTAPFEWLGSTAKVNVRHRWVNRVQRRRPWDYSFEFSRCAVPPPRTYLFSLPECHLS